MYHLKVIYKPRVFFVSESLSAQDTDSLPRTRLSAPSEELAVATGGGARGRGGGELRAPAVEILIPSRAGQWPRGESVPCNDTLQTAPAGRLQTTPATSYCSSGDSGPQQFPDQSPWPGAVMKCF